MAETVGTADGIKCKPAGLSGFRLASSDKKDCDAYRNVRQYRWTLDFVGGGGHYTWTRYHNLNKTIVPMFSAPTSRAFCTPSTDCSRGWTTRVT